LQILGLQKNREEGGGRREVEAGRREETGGKKEYQETKKSGSKAWLCAEFGILNLESGIDFNPSV
jgi:hypothetical protein